MQVPPAVCATLTLMFDSVSLNLAAVSAVVFGLVSVNVSVEVPPAVIVGRLKALAIVGADKDPGTVRVLSAAVPVSATGPVAVGRPVVLIFVVVAVTLWVMVQVPPGTMVPVVKPTAVPPFVPPVKLAFPKPLHRMLPAALFTKVPV